MKIVFAGDLCFRSCDANVSTEKLYQEIMPIFDAADFRMLNLECPLYDGAAIPILKCGPNIMSETKYVKHLCHLHIDLAGLANNHIGDYGEAPIIGTIKLLSEHGIASVGAGETIEKAYEAHILKKDDVSVSVLAVCENEFGVATRSTAGSAGLNLFRLQARIAKEKEKADHVVIFFHGGNETAPFPSPGKTELYRSLIDFGADAVVCTHTHCPQGVELYQNKPIVYSMGNFYFPKADQGMEDRYSSWYYGYLAMLHFERTGISLEIHPYRFGTASEPMTLLKGESRKRFMEYLNELTTPIGDPEALEHLFRIWSAYSGEAYEFSMHYDPKMKGTLAHEIAPFKNLFSCEAHHEMIKCFTELCYTNSFEKFREQTERICKYQDLKAFLSTVSNFV